MTIFEDIRDRLKLGPGSHFGEWFGKGIQSGYGKAERTFALFNTSRWSDPATRPACCAVVPVLYEGLFEEMPLDDILDGLREKGSVMVPGFPHPEGIVIFHTASGVLFKKTLEKDESPKGKG